LAKGSHSFYCKAYDATGNSANSASVTVTVNNQIVTSGPWAKSFGGVGDTDYAMATVVDGSGNVVITGVFQGLVNLGGGTLTGAGTGYNIFVAKYSPTGAPLWSKRFGTSTASEVPKCMALDSAGNIFIGGALAGGSLMKLDSSGNLLWVKGPVATRTQNVNFGTLPPASQRHLV